MLQSSAWMGSNGWFLPLVLLIISSMELVSCSRTFTSHRLMQYEQNRQPLGSQQSHVDHLASPLKGNHDLGRNIAVVKLSDLTLTLLKSLSDRRAQSVLIILPLNMTSVSDEFANHFQEEIETFFLSNTFDFSIFFAFEDDVTNDIISNTYSLSNPGNSLSLSNAYHLKGSETSESITGIQYTNLYGIMRQETAEKYVVIAANHDSYGVVPTLSVGANDNGSGVNALIQVMSLLKAVRSKLARAEENGAARQKYNVLFLLTAGGYTNHEGTKRWLDQNEGGSLFLPNIELVICLNALAGKNGNNELYLHATPKLLEDENEAKRNLFETIAKAQGLDLVIETKDVTKEKTNINAWHHEAFARKDLLALTLSGKKDATPLKEGTSILDTKDRMSVQRLESSIDYLGTVLTALIFDMPASENWKDILKWKNETGYAINRAYMRNYVEFMGHTPRVGPYTFKSKYITKLYDDMLRTCDEAKRMKYKPESGFEKFSSTHPITIEVFLVKPFLFDLTFLTCVFSYLFLYFLAIKRPKSMEEFKELFATEE